jgi:DNA-binding NarL/FixJ family response regulator
MEGLQGVQVAVVARSEVARLGLARMLETIPRAGDYALFQPDEFEEAAADSIQLLILSCRVLILWCANGGGTGDDAWAAQLAAVARRNGIPVVLVLPQVAYQLGEPGALISCEGVLDQDTLTAESLDEALGRLAAGGRLPADRPAPPAARRLAAPIQPQPAIAMLTDRERHVVELLVEGLSNKQIGHQLAMSEHGAKRLVAIVLAKLRTPNRTQAVAVALREGLVASHHGRRA